MKQSVSKRAIELGVVTQAPGGEGTEPEGVGGTTPARRNEPLEAADPEVQTPKRRRQFSASEKLRIVEAADRCQAPGELGQLMRREGIYSSMLSNWRHARDQGALSQLRARRGPKPRRDERDDHLAKLERENARLQKQLTQAHTIIEVQKKLRRSWATRSTKTTRATHERDHDSGGNMPDSGSLPCGEGAALHLLPLAEALTRHVRITPQPAAHAQ